MGQNIVANDDIEVAILMAGCKVAFLHYLTYSTTYYILPDIILK